MRGILSGARPSVCAASAHPAAHASAPRSSTPVSGSIPRRPLRTAQRPSRSSHSMHRGPRLSAPIAPSPGGGGGGGADGQEPSRARGGVCRGFVGEGASSIAGAYYASDFSWASRIEEGEAALTRQLLELAEWRQQQQQQEQQVAKQECVSPAEHLLATHAALSGTHAAASSSRATSPATLETRPKSDGSAAGPMAAATPPADEANEIDYDRGSWEGFHAQHSQARFFKERRYLLLEFPQLALGAPPQHFVEIGCGCGSSLLPVLRANPSCRVTGCDISPTAVRLFLEAAARYGISPDRVSAFAFDAALGAGAGAEHTSQQQEQQDVPAHAQTASSSNGTVMISSSGGGCDGSNGSSGGSSPLERLGADAALLIFTLSALPPREMPVMLRHAWCALRPGGRLLFRDYGRFDMAQLRFPGSQMLGEDLYRRGDGTLSYFFTPEGMAALAQAAGFEVEECEYACTALRNRKLGGPDMKRVFVHGVFRRPN